MTATSATDCIIAATYFCMAIMYVHLKYFIDAVKPQAQWWDQL